MPGVLVSDGHGGAVKATNRWKGTASSINHNSVLINNPFVVSDLVIERIANEL